MSGPGARLQLVVFLVEGQRYGIRVSAVERVLAMVAVSPLPGAPSIALGVINVGGTVLPVLDPRRRLGLPSRRYGVSDHLLVARTARRTVAMPVDEVLGVTEAAAEAVVDPDALLRATGGIAGIVALPDGLLYIDDLEAFLSPDEERGLTDALGRIQA